MSPFDSLTEPASQRNWTIPDLSDPSDKGFHVDFRPLTIGFVSTMPPTRCGIAAFAADLMTSIQNASEKTRGIAVPILQAADARGLSAIVKDDRGSYHRVAKSIVRNNVDVLCIQHEYGIFGGPDGDMVLDLVHAVDMPIVLTLHTVLECPTAGQKCVMDALVARADRVVVMTQHSAAAMRAIHAAPAEKIYVIPHGVPALHSNGRESGRAMLGVGGQSLLLTFGLLSPGKGIEHVIRALPAIVAQTSDVIYVVLGVTHPNLVREQGEAYRESLVQLADQLGVSGYVRFVDRYFDVTDLTSVLDATDIYITPYLNEAQSVSGTLAYSYGLGTAVISTPYRHAAELLADGRGVLVPFADSGAIGEAVKRMLANPADMVALRARARTDGLAVTWPHVGQLYAALFEGVMSSRLDALSGQLDDA